MPRPAPDIPTDPIITTLRTTRLRRGIGQATIATATGVDRTSVTGWENGRVDPPLPRLRAWAAALGYDLRLMPYAAARTGDLFVESFTADASDALPADGYTQGKPCRPIPCPPIEGPTTP